jgi:MULE transposase domain
VEECLWYLYQRRFISAHDVWVIRPNVWVTISKVWNTIKFPLWRCLQCLWSQFVGLFSQKVPPNDSCINHDLSDGSPAEKLIHYLESTPNMYCVLLYDHLDSKLVTVRKPSKKEISSTQADMSGVVTESILPGHQQQAATEYIKSLRKSLMVADSQKILLAAAWISDEERRLVSLYPEVLGVDITEQTNKEKHPLLILAGLTGDNKTFTAARALLRSAQRWVFTWFFVTVLPALIPQKAREQNTVMFTDGDELEYNAFKEKRPLIILAGLTGDN